jgi:adenylosuccinate synthase
VAPALDASDRIAVVGLGFGDEGKGSVVDALARRLGASAVVRFNGGPQAAHHVVTPDLRTHCFSQLGAALLASPSVHSFSGPRVLVEPLSLLREAEALASLGAPNPLPRLHLDERSVVVTPFHRLMNRAAEIARGPGRHGSCGLGVGQAYTDALNPAVPSVRLGELRDPDRLRRKLELIRVMKLDLVEQLRDAHPHALLAPILAELRRRDITAVTLDGYGTLLRRVDLREVTDPGGPLLLEGAQGALLDETHGFWPHVTPSTTTFAWADELCREPPYRLGVLRAFSTRHGAGPFVAEAPPRHQESPPRHQEALLLRQEALLRGEHNALNDWQGSFRVGPFDLVAARHAIDLVGGVDGLAITCLDRLRGLPTLEVVAAWSYPGDAAEVADLFELDGATIHGIRREDAPTRARQRRLTEALDRCTPILRTLPSEGALLAEIEQALQAPVVLRSRGPTAEQKE